MERSAEFVTATDPYRRELITHCYRMLGSIHDAEDLVQEVYLRAWRAFDTYDPHRASPRTWLYRIATNACLTALKARRPLPSGLSGPADPVTAPLDRRTDVPWLQPIPDTRLDPATVVTGRDTVRLAFIAALQHLPARQRAVLILRDVLAWQATEVAELLDLSTAAVNSALQRARAKLGQVTPVPDEITDPEDPGYRRFLARYVAAFERADMAGLIDILRDDVVLEMPPFPVWFTGRDAVAKFLPRITGVGSRRTVPTRANARPALATYTREAGAWHAHALHVPTITVTGVREILVFLDPALFPAFGLPVTEAA